MDEGIPNCLIDQRHFRHRFVIWFGRTVLFFLDPSMETWELFFFFWQGGRGRGRWWCGVFWVFFSLFFSIAVALCIPPFSSLCQEKLVLVAFFLSGFLFFFFNTAQYLFGDSVRMKFFAKVSKARKVREEDGGGFWLCSLPTAIVVPSTHQHVSSEVESKVTWPHVVRHVWRIKQWLWGSRMREQTFGAGGEIESLSADKRAVRSSPDSACFRLWEICHCWCLASQLLLCFESTFHAANGAQAKQKCHWYLAWKVALDVV